MQETLISDEYQVTERIGGMTYVPVSSGHFDAAEPGALERAQDYRDTCQETADAHLGEGHRLQYVVRRIRVTEIVS